MRLFRFVLVVAAMCALPCQAFGWLYLSGDQYSRVVGSSSNVQFQQDSSWDQYFNGYFATIVSSEPAYILFSPDSSGMLFSAADFYNWDDDTYEYTSSLTIVSNYCKLDLNSSDFVVQHNDKYMVEQSMVPVSTSNNASDSDIASVASFFLGACSASAFAFASGRQSI
jgi:hypothetical protein